MGDFAACVDFTLGMEGGYGADPDDPGNWTGGRLVKGNYAGPILALVRRHIQRSTLRI